MPDMPADHPTIAPSDPKSQVTVQWLGHSCFFIYTPGGVVVVTDPFDPQATGLPSPDLNAHLVTVSSQRPDHAFTNVVGAFQGEQRQVVYGKEARVKDLRVIPVDAGGGDYAYVLEAGPMRIAHLGGLKRPLSPENIKKLGPVDILLIPAGGEGVTQKQSVEMAKQIAPKVVIPMAYAATGMDGPDGKLGSFDEFVSAGPFAVTDKEADTILISKPELPPTTQVYRLQFRRL
jgi:L-ascorbate metabolism protein UlaG (beta-lactamase superfamily)